MTLPAGLLLQTRKELLQMRVWILVALGIFETLEVSGYLHNHDTYHLLTALGIAATMVAVNVWLETEIYRLPSRMVKLDAQGVQRDGRTHPWSEFKSVRVYSVPGKDFRKLTLYRRSDSPIEVHFDPDLVDETALAGYVDAQIATARP